MIAKKVHKLVWSDAGNYGNFHVLCKSVIRHGRCTTEDSGVTCLRCLKSMKRMKR